jgi:hypothetical protein
MTVHRNKFIFNKTNRRTNSQIYSGTQLYMAGGKIKKEMGWACGAYGGGESCA